MDAQEKKTCSVFTLLTPSDRAALDQLVRSTGKTRSSILRDAFQAYLKQQHEE